MLDQRIFLLRGKVQHYAWGGTRFLPELLGVENPENKPFAEYWMGAQDQLPSEILLPDGNAIALNEFIAKDPAGALGAKVNAAFGKLPFLFKVLDVKDMLSIQVHPTIEEAKKGYAREEAAGIQISDPKRSYKDENHKPEIMVALSEFWLLHGFKSEQAIVTVINQFPSFKAFLPILKEGSVEKLYHFIMSGQQSMIDAALAPIAAAIVPLYRAGKLSKADPSFWAARAIEQYNGGQSVNLDRGIFSIYFFNLLQLHPGEAIFQGAGIPHAYLEGQNMELMANSDNVLRGGLTPKHIDVEQLLAHTSFQAVQPLVYPDQERYPTSVPDFSIAKLSIPVNEIRECQNLSAAIIFVIFGAIDLVYESTSITVNRGEAAFIMGNTTYTARSLGGSATYFMASAGLDIAE